MSFATRKMTDADLGTSTEIAMPYKTATPQLLPPMLRLNASCATGTQKIITSPAAVEITISRSQASNNPLATIEQGACLFKTNFQNRPFSAPLEQASDYPQHDAFSTVPDLKQRLSKLDKEIRVGEEVPDSIKSVVQMHNSVLQKNDASISKLKTKNRETRNLCKDLAEMHSNTSANTKEYLEMAQTMMESHSSSIHDQQQQINKLLNNTHAKDKTHEYLTLSQNVFETHNDAIHKLQEQSERHMEHIDEIHGLLQSSSGINTKEYLQMNQRMMESHNTAIAELQNNMKQTMNLSQQVSELRETIQLHEDEFDALHEVRAT